MKKEIHVDYSATTPVRPEVLQSMLPYFSEQFGNPSSIYRKGRDANRGVEDAAGGLPPVKMHCSMLAEEAVHAAIANYYERQGLPVPFETKKSSCNSCCTNTCEVAHK